MHHYIWGFAPNPDLGFFFPKKNPKSPKKPDCIGFRLSSIDSEQGCRKAALFLCSAHTVRHRNRPAPLARHSSHIRRTCSPPRTPSLVPAAHLPCTHRPRPRHVARVAHPQRLRLSPAPPLICRTAHSPTVHPAVQSCRPSPYHIAAPVSPTQL